MRDDDRRFYLKREYEERCRAAAAVNPVVAARHFELARRYRELVKRTPGEKHSNFAA